MKKRIFVMAFLVVGLLVFSAFTAEKVVKIGAFCPLTGPYVDVGTDIRNGIELAVGLQNEAGGIEIGGEKYQVEIVWGDTESKVEVGLSVIDKLVTVDKIDVAVGFLHSHIFIPASEKFQAYHIPVVDACAASVGIFKKVAELNLDYVFQESPTTNDITRAVCAAVNYYIKPKKLAILNENTDAGRDFGSMTEAWFKENAPEVKVVYHEYVSQNITDYTAELAKIKATGANVIIGEIYGASASAFFEQWHEMRVPATFVTMGATTASQEFIDELKEELEGTLLNNRWWPGAYTEVSLERMEAYRTKYGEEPTNFAIQGHDATKIAMDAIALADSLDKRDIRAALEGGSFVGIWGIRDFSPLEEGHSCPTPMVVVQVQGGQKVPLWPLSIAGEYMPVPPWPWEK